MTGFWFTPDPAGILHVSRIHFAAEITNRRSVLYVSALEIVGEDDVANWG